MLSVFGGPGTGVAVTKQELGQGSPAAGSYHRHRYQRDRCAEQQTADNEQGDGEPCQLELNR